MNCNFKFCVMTLDVMLGWNLCGLWLTKLEQAFLALIGIVPFHFKMFNLNISIKLL